MSILLQFIAWKPSTHSDLKITPALIAKWSLKYVVYFVIYVLFGYIKMYLLLDLLLMIN